jgi:hypothetical protein
MQTRSDLEKKLLELQNQYQNCLIERKEFGQLKAIKNDIKKLHTALHQKS